MFLVECSSIVVKRSMSLICVANLRKVCSIFLSIVVSCTFLHFLNFDCFLQIIHMEFSQNVSRSVYSSALSSAGSSETLIIKEKIKRGDFVVHLFFIHIYKFVYAIQITSVYKKRIFMHYKATEVILK